MRAHPEWGAVKRCIGERQNLREGARRECSEDSG